MPLISTLKCSYTSTLVLQVVPSNLSILICWPFCTKECARAQKRKKSSPLCKDILELCLISRFTDGVPRFVCMCITPCTNTHAHTTQHTHMCLKSHWVPDHSSASSECPGDQVLDGDKSWHQVRWRPTPRVFWVWLLQVRAVGKGKKGDFLCFLYLICNLFSPYFLLSLSGGKKITRLS